jgi:hypothetical protein
MLHCISELSGFREYIVYLELLVGSTFNTYRIFLELFLALGDYWLAPPRRIMAP